MLMASVYCGDWHLSNYRFWASFTADMPNRPRLKNLLMGLLESSRTWAITVPVA